MRTRILCLLVIATAAAFAMPACGGGGSDGGSGGSPALEGSYAFLLLEFIDGDRYLRSTVGVLRPDGAGGLTIEAIRSVQDGTPKTAAISPLSYVANGPQRIVITDRTGRRFDADLSANGSLIAATTRQAGTQPALMILAPRAASPTLAALAGDWMEVAFGRDTTDDGGGPDVGDYAMALDEELELGGHFFIDGGPELYFRDYSFLPAIGSSTTTLELREGGEIAWLRPFDGLTSHVGRLSSDGNMMLLGGEYTSHKTCATVVVRRDQPTTAAQLSGMYRVNGMGSTIIGHADRWGETSFDGTGGGSSTYERNIEGVLVGSNVAFFTYVLDAQGRVDVTWGTEDIPFLGIVGAGGAYVVLAGRFEDGGRAEFRILLR